MTDPSFASIGALPAELFALLRDSGALQVASSYNLVLKHLALSLCRSEILVSLDTLPLRCVRLSSLQMCLTSSFYN